MTFSIKFTYWLRNLTWCHVLRYCPNAVHPYEWEDWHHTMDRRKP